MDVYVVLDGAQIVAISARLQGAEMRRADEAKRLVAQGGQWASYQAMYERLRIENHELYDLDQ